MRKIAVDRIHRLTGLLRGYLEDLAGEDQSAERKRGQLEALEHSFKTLQFRIGKRTWKRAELYDRF